MQVINIFYLNIAIQLIKARHSSPLLTCKNAYSGKFHPTSYFRFVTNALTGHKLLSYDSKVGHFYVAIQIIGSF